MQAVAAALSQESRFSQAALWRCSLEPHMLASHCHLSSSACAPNASIIRKQSLPNYSAAHDASGFVTARVAASSRTGSIISTSALCWHRMPLSFRRLTVLQLQTWCFWDGVSGVVMRLAQSQQLMTSPSTLFRIATLKIPITRSRNTRRGCQAGFHQAASCQASPPLPAC